MSMSVVPSSRWMAIRRLLRKHPDLCEVLRNPHERIQNLRRELLIKGTLTMKQIEYAMDLAAFGTGLGVDPGRYRIEGRIVKRKFVKTRFSVSPKMLVDFGGWFAWGSFPKDLHGLEVIGAKVRMNVTFSEQDGIAYFSRPSGVEVVS